MDDENEKMLFEDDDGKILMSDEVDELSPWEIEERKLHLYEKNLYEEKWF
jgi:hypothetical protein